MQCCSSILVDQVWLYKMEVACSDIPDIMFRQSTNSMFRQSHWSPVLFIFTVVLNFFTVILSLINSMLSCIHVSYAHLQNVISNAVGYFFLAFSSLIPVILPQSTKRSVLLQFHKNFILFTFVYNFVGFVKYTIMISWVIVFLFLF